jgi:NAD(P)-dependent dehydrogenase (short-subunit alcohol dehydrogenase family)
MTQPQDPKDAGAKPPYPAPQQDVPGTEAALTPAADHGEQSYRGSGRLEGRVALITGGDSGIGRAVALAFAREGADVAISYLNEHEDARATVALVEEAGRRALSIAGDISDEAHCASLVRRTVDELGRLDVLVNNAMFWLCRAALPHMQPGASIINTTSIQSSQPTGQLLPYAATKAAIANFTMGLAQEAAERGVRVNAVAPGPVWTPLIPATMPEEKVRTFGQDTLLKRAAQPKEMAPIFVLLASDEGSYITGMIYGATGGKPLV